MNKPVLRKRFVDVGATNYNSDNFQNFLFQELEFGVNGVPINFFKCDFRGSSFINVRFKKSNFDRSDFINSYLSDTTFSECYFGTDFSNTLFNRVQFVNNEHDTCTYSNSKFLNCLFDHEHIIASTLRSSTFAACTFLNCKFEQNTLDEIAFENCVIKTLSFSDMGAYNLSFENCELENIVVDPDYLGSYLFKNSSFNGLIYEYRGHEINLTGSLAKDYLTLSIFYLENQRYFESLNTHILHSFLAEKVPIDMNFVESIFLAIKQYPHGIGKYDQMDRAIKLLIFYIGSDVMAIESTMKIVSLIENLKIEFDNLNDRLRFNSNLFLLKENVEHYLFESRELKGVQGDKMLYVEFQIDQEDFSFFQEELDSFFHAVSVELAITQTNQTYTIVGSRKGSLIVEVVAISIGVYTLARIARGILGVVHQIIMDYRIKTKALNLLGQPEKLIELEKSVKIANKILSRPSDELITKSGSLVRLLKAFHIFPNTMFKGE